MKLPNSIDYKYIFKEKNLKELEKISDYLRNFLINRSLQKGGHIGSDLGVLELTISLLNNYDLDESIMLFDTGHQSHVYKYFTNTIEEINNMGEFNGISIFPEMSDHNLSFFSGGHTSTALHYATGYSLLSDKKNIIVIIGDAAFLTGLSFSGLLNIINNSKKKITVILNDNNEAIGKNYLSIPDIKMFFESLSFNYFKCDDGHNFLKLQEVFNEEKKIKTHTVVHIKTIKARGFKIKEKLFLNHSILSDEFTTSSDLIVEELLNIFDDQTYLISPATLGSSKLEIIKNKYPNNVFDTGINEDAAILLAGSLAMQNKKVFVSMYSAFFSRAMDQFVHDIIRNKLNIVLLVDKIGLSYKNGISHHGIYDLLFTNISDQVIIATPSEYFEIKKLLSLAKQEKEKTYIIRYENFKCTKNNNLIDFKNGEWENVIYDDSNKITIFSYGELLLDLKNNLENKNINLINSRFLNPIDLKKLDSLKSSKWFIYEHTIGNSNLFDSIKENFKNKKDIYKINLDSLFIGHGNKNTLLKSLALDIKTIIDKITGDM